MANKSSASAIPVAVGAALAAASLAAVAWIIIAMQSYKPIDATSETMNAMQHAAYVVQCAFWIDEKAPASLAEAQSTISANPTKAEAVFCDGWGRMKAQHVEYTAIESSNIRLCGKFEFASLGSRAPRSYAVSGLFTELDGHRPKAGRHCFEIHLQEAPPTENPWPPVDPF